MSPVTLRWWTEENLEEKDKERKEEEIEGEEEEGENYDFKGMQVSLYCGLSGDNTAKNFSVCQCSVVKIYFM